MTVIDEYLTKVKSPQKEELERVRKAILKVAPEAEEVITYGMPGFKYQGKYLISFAAFKDHMSIFPGSGAIAQLGAKLSKFKLSKGTVQFTLENPLPETTLKKIVEARIKEINQT